MLQITESEILEAYDAFELSESELIELYSEGYISENTMDQLIEMGIFDEFLYEQEELEEGFLKRHGKSMIKGALVAGALGAGAGALAPVAAPVAAAVGVGTGLAHLGAGYLGRKKFDKKKLDLIKQNKSNRDIAIKHVNSPLLKPYRDLNKDIAIRSHKAAKDAKNLKYPIFR